MARDSLIRQLCEIWFIWSARWIRQILFLIGCGIGVGLGTKWSVDVAYDAVLRLLRDLRGL